MRRAPTQNPVSRPLRILSVGIHLRLRRPPGLPSYSIPLYTGLPDPRVI